MHCIAVNHGMRRSKRVEVAGATDKRQITAVIGGRLSGNLLPIQLIYQRKDF